MQCLIADLASTRYTRMNPDPDLVDHVDDPKNLFRRHWYQTPHSQSRPVPLVRSVYLPAKLLSLEDIPYDINFELSLFKSKSKIYLSDIVFDPLRLSEVKYLSELDSSPLEDWFL